MRLDRIGIETGRVLLLHKAKMMGTAFREMVKSEILYIGVGDRKF